MRAPDFDPEEFLAELRRVAPSAAEGSDGFSLPVPPAKALAALRALPDNAGIGAVLRALRHDRGAGHPGTGAPPGSP
jgi:hypothetical protein